MSSNIPKSWEIVNLGKLGKWSSGGTPLRSHPEYYGGDIPWVKTGNLPDGLIVEIDEYLTKEGLKNSSAKLFPSGSLIVAMYGATIGKLGIINNPAATNQACAVLIAQDITTKLIPYLFNYLLFSREDLKKIGQGGAQPNISQTIIKEYLCPLPPLNEQKRIVAKIEALQTRSQRVKEELEGIKPLLDQFRQSVLAAAFRGDLTKDWREQNPDIEPAEVWLERIRGDRRRRWEEAELEKMKANGKVPKDDSWKKKYKEPEAIDDVDLPELPDGWCWGILELIADAIDPQPSHRTPPEVPNGIPYVSIGDVLKDGTINFEKARKVSSKVLKEHKDRYTLRKGDFIFGKIGTLGKPVKLPLNIDYTLSANIILIQPQQNYVVSDWLFLYMKSPFVEDLLTKNSRATSQAAFGIKKIRVMVIPLTPLEEQNEIVHRIESLFKLADNIEQQYQQAEANLDTLNQSILAKAFRGELVPQDPNDEPASVLLERIKAERAKQEGTGKKAKKKDAKEAKAHQLDLNL